MSCKLPYIESKFRLTNPTLADKLNNDTLNTFKAIKESKLFTIKDSKFTLNKVGTNKRTNQENFINNFNTEFTRPIIFIKGDIVSVNVLTSFKYDANIIKQDNLPSTKTENTQSTDTINKVKPFSQEEVVYDVIPNEVLSSDLRLFKSKLNKEQVQVFESFIQLLNSINPDFKVEEKVDTKTFIDFSNSIIRINSDASLEDFTEEIIHLFTELLPDDKLDELRSLVMNTPYYKDVLNEYGDLEEYQEGGKPNYTKLQTEAVVKMINDKFHKNKVDNNNGINTKNTTLIEKAFNKLMDFIKSLFSPYNVNLLNEIVEDLTKNDISKLDLNKDIYSNGIYYSLDYHKVNNSELKLLNVKVNDYNDIVIEADMLFTEGVLNNRGLELQDLINFHESNITNRINIVGATAEQKILLGNNLKFSTLYHDAFPKIIGKSVYVFNNKLRIINEEKLIDDLLIQLHSNIVLMNHFMVNTVDGSSLLSSLVEMTKLTDLSTEETEKYKKAIEDYKALRDSGASALDKFKLLTEVLPNRTKAILSTYYNIENGFISPTKETKDIVNKQAVNSDINFISNTDISLIKDSFIPFKDRLIKSSDSNLELLKDFFTSLLQQADISNTDNIKKAEATKIIEATNKVLNNIKFVSLNFSLINNLKNVNVSTPDFTSLNNVTNVKELITQMGEFISFLNHADNAIYSIINREWNSNDPGILRDLSQATSFINQWTNMLVALQDTLFVDNINDEVLPIIKVMLTSFTGAKDLATKKIEDKKLEIYTDKVYNELVVPYNASIINTFKENLKTILEKKNINETDINEVLDLLPASVGDKYKTTEKPIYPDELKELFINKIASLNIDEKLKGLLIDKFGNQLALVYHNSLTQDIVSQMLTNEITLEDFVKNGLLADGKLLPIIDKYLVGLKFANDPLLAYTGNLMDSINYDVMQSFDSNVAKPYESLYELINKLGGEVEVGKALTFVYNLTEIDTYIKDGITYSKLVTRPTKVFKNRYGDFYNWDTGFTFTEEDLALLEELGFEHNNSSYNQLRVHQSNLRELLGQPLEDSVIKRVEDLYTRINNKLSEVKEEWFHNKYSDKYNTIIDGVYTDTLRILKLAGVNTDRKKLTKELEDYNKRKQSLYNEKTLLINQLNLQSIDNNYEIINSLNNRIQLINAELKDFNKVKEIGDKDFNVSLLSRKLSDKKKNMYDTSYSYQHFYSDIKARIKLLTPHAKDAYIEHFNNLEKLFSEDIIDNDKVQLAFISLHQALNQITTKLLSKEDLESLNQFKIFLNSNISYNANDTFYNKRQKLFNERTKLFINLGHSSYIFEQVTPTTNVIDSLDEIDLEEGKSDTYYLKVNITGVPKYVKVESTKVKNRLINKLNRVQGSVDIDELWNQIFEITSKYRDDSGFIVNVPYDEQLKIKALQNSIEQELFKLRNIPTDKLSRDRRNEINEKRNELEKITEALNELEGKFITDELTFTFLNFFINYRTERFNEFSNGTFSSVSDWLKSLTIEDIKRLEQEYLYYPDNFSEGDKLILDWLSATYYTKLNLDNIAITETKAFTYNFTRTIPNAENISYFNFNLNKFYSESQLKEEYLRKDTFKDVYGHWLPKFDSEKVKEKLSTDEIALAFKDLDNHSNADDIKTIYEKWVEQVHIKNQKDNANKASGNKGLNGYKVATMKKQNAELDLYRNLKKMYDTVMGKVNPLEHGIDVTDEEKVSFRQRIMNFFKTLFTTPMNKWRDAVRSTKKAKYDKQVIPVYYTSYMEGNEVTDDIFTSTNAYLHDLMKSKYLHDNSSNVFGLNEFMKNNSKNVVNNRQERFEKYITSIVYKKGIGGNSTFAKILRQLGRLLVWKSQTVFNIGGNIKNIEAGLISNFIQSGNTHIGKFGINKLKTDMFTSGSAFKLAFKIVKERQKLQPQSIESYITYLVNPQLKNIEKLLPSNLNTKNYLKSFDVFFAGIEGGETWISFQIMTSILNQLYIKDVEGNQIKVQDAFENVDGVWKLKEVYHSNGERVTLEDFRQVAKEVEQIKFNTIGRTPDKGAAFYNNNTSKLLFFSNYLIPLFVQNFTLTRNDYVTNRIVTNHNKALLDFISNSIKYLYNYKANYWEVMSNHEKRNLIKALSLYCYMALLWVMVKGLLGFDPEDEDKYKDIKENSNLENFLLYVSLRTMSELDTQSLIWDSTGDDFAPVITKNMNTTIQIKGQAENLYKFMKHIVTGETYKKGNKELGIEEGSYKAVEDFNKNFIPWHNRDNFGYMTSVFLKMQNK